MKRLLQRAATAALGAAMTLVARAAPLTPEQVQGLKDAAVTLDAAVVLNIQAGIAIGQQAGLTLDPQAPTTRTTTTEFPADAEGPAGQRRVTVSQRVEGSGSRVTIHAEYQVQQTRGGLTLNARGRATVSLDYCPDTQGQVNAQIELQVSGDDAASSAAASGGFSVNIAAKGRALGQVNDQALLASVNQQFEGTHSLRGGARAQSGDGRNIDARRAFGGSFRVNSSQTVNQFTRLGSGDRPWVQLGDKTADRSAVGASDNADLTRGYMHISQIVLDEAIKSVFDRAQAKWRDGACLAILVRPPVQGGGATNATQPKERKRFEVAVRHLTENTELPLPVDATLNGRDTLRPTRVERAPGTFDFTAGSAPDDYGRVELKSVSRRGIAKDDVLFDNDPRLGGKVQARTRSGPMTLSSEGQLTWQSRGGAADQFVPSGTLKVQGTRQTCSVRGEANIGAGDGQLHVQRDAQGRITAYRGMGMTAVTLHIKCERSADTRVVPIPWLNTTMGWRPAGDGGRLEGTQEDGETRWSWHFTR